ncbi:hypothetical protein ACFL2Q_15855 [Thermodesulfobacteriota bacterium]
MRSRIGETGLLSDDNRHTFVFKEKRKEYIARNADRKRILCYRIDGQMIIEGERCDHGMGLPETNAFYLIELKCSDLRKAARQILSTIDSLGERLDGFVLHGRVVLSRTPVPDQRSSDVLRLERRLARLKGNFKKQSRRMEETV